jgi:hypothetical protein
MTLHQTHLHPARHRVPPEYRPRLRLTPKARCADSLDGAWWPRSRILGMELPDLLPVLAVRLGPVGRVLYDAAGWARTPRRLMVAGEHAVRLDSYRSKPFKLLFVYGIDDARIVLRVIPASTDDDAAQSALTAAASLSDNVDGDAVVYPGAAAPTRLSGLRPAESRLCE